MKQQVEVIVTYSEGWQERFAKAAYELYQEVKEERSERRKTFEA